MTTLILNTAANEYASPVKQYSSSNANYDTARNAVSVAPTNQGVVQPGQFHRSTPMYWVERSLLGYNLTNLPPGSVISSAILSNTSEQCWASEAFDMVVLDGTGLTGVAGDFGAMKLLTTSLGSCSFPADGLKDYAYSITLNAAGRALMVEQFTLHLEQIMKLLVHLLVMVRLKLGPLMPTMHLLIPFLPLNTQL
jgi:hypothetical protein